MEFDNIRYKIIKLLGSGSNSHVYLGYDNEKKINVSIKKLIVNERNKSEAILRFKNEAETIDSFCHPNIVKLLDVFEKKNEIYLIMEYFEGIDLKKSRNKFSLSEKVSIMKKVSETLDYIHSRGIIHRDLKPENILVKNNDGIEIKIIDFGLAHFNDLNDFSKKNKMVGSFSYISPEQTGFLKRSIDNRSDLYSIGATCYHFLTNKAPFYDDNIGIIRNKKVISIFDVTKHSGKRRLYVINTDDGKVSAIHVAHGKNSDKDHDGVATAFSNTNGSNQSSLGFMLTDNTYQSGKNGYSLKLDGLESRNSNVRKRYVVIHGADYVSPNRSKMGRSYGCPAVSRANTDWYIHKVKNGSLLYIYHADHDG